MVFRGRSNLLESRYDISASYHERSFSFQNASVSCVGDKIKVGEGFHTVGDHRECRGVNGRRRLRAGLRHEVVM